MYAAAPLRWEETIYVGSLCILDKKPWAELSLEQCDSLCKMAGRIMMLCKQVITTPICSTPPSAQPEIPSPEATGSNDHVMRGVMAVASGFMLESRACP